MSTVYVKSKGADSLVREEMSPKV